MSTYELEQNVEKKLGNAMSQFLPTEGIVKLTLLPFRDHHATLATTFAIADTKCNISGFSFLQTYCQTLGTEHTCPILKYNTHNATRPKQKLLLQTSHKQPPFFSKVFKLTVKKHINIPGRHIKVNKFTLTKI